MKKILLSFTAILLLPVFNLAWAGLYMVGDAVSDDWDTRLAMTETQDGIYTSAGQAADYNFLIADGSGIVDVEVNCNGVYVVTANCLSKRVLVY